VQDKKWLHWKNTKNREREWEGKRDCENIPKRDCWDIKGNCEWCGGGIYELNSGVEVTGDSCLIGISFFSSTRREEREWEGWGGRGGCTEDKEDREVICCGGSTDICGSNSWLKVP
jgi:hypothetical protein